MDAMDTQLIIGIAANILLAVAIGGVIGMGGHYALTVIRRFWA